VAAVLEKAKKKTMEDTKINEIKKMEKNIINLSFFHIFFTVSRTHTEKTANGQVVTATQLEIYEGKSFHFWNEEEENFSLISFEGLQPGPTTIHILPTLYIHLQHGNQNREHCEPQCRDCGVLRVSECECHGCARAADGTQD
jgi:hypothetical protein